MVKLIVMAAGLGRRYGGNKLMAQVGGQTLLHRALAAASQADWGEIILVVGADLLPEAQKLSGTLLKGFPVQIVPNPQRELGISHTIALGIEHAGEWDGLCFLVCDQPWLTGKTLRRLTEQFRQEYAKNEQSIVCLRSAGEWGNPVIFSRSYREELLALTGDQGGKRVMKAHLDAVSFLTTTAAQELFDIDTKEDLAYCNQEKQEERP